jgi:hypothetical protein
MGILSIDNAIVNIEKGRMAIFNNGAVRIDRGPGTTWVGTLSVKDDGVLDITPNTTLTVIGVIDNDNGGKIQSNGTIVIEDRGITIGDPPNPPGTITGGGAGQNSNWYAYP